MKKELIIFIIALTILISSLCFFYVSIVNAEVNLEQCTINNNIDACNQSLEKSLEVVEVEPVVEPASKLTLEDFIVELVKIVEERKAKDDIVITTSFGSDAYDSVLIENKNEMKCVNDVCALEKEWK